MIRLPNTEAQRLVVATAVLHTNVWDVEHLRIIRRRLSDGYVQNMSRFERDHGDRSYSRLVSAFDYAAWRLENEGVIHPDDLEIVEAYASIPRFTGTAADDAVRDLRATIRARLTEALKRPLDQTGTPRDPALAKAA